MDKWRNRFDSFYNLIKEPVFSATKRNPEWAHHMFTLFCQTLYHTGLDKIVLDNGSNQQTPPWQISNAAGFNKNAEIAPRTMGWLGVKRTVIGTVTADPWKGAPKPRAMRFPETNSLVNWMGLPGIGAEKVAERLWNYTDSRLPITINLMSTPQKSGRKLLRDLEKTTLTTIGIPNVDRLELNLSCPNTHGADGKIDARASNQDQQEPMIDIVRSNMYATQDLYVKVSPDLDERSIDKLIRICDKYDVAGFTTTNTTTHHDKRYIPKSPEQGGASGDAVYPRALEVQKLFAKRTDKKLIACGGISSVERAKERCAIGNTSEIQIYTPIIFKGPGLLRELREAI
jgi:dihydroorotate dehydrogenase